MREYNELFTAPFAKKFLERDFEGLKQDGFTPADILLLDIRKDENPLLRARLKQGIGKPLSTHERQEVITHVTPPDALHQSEEAHYTPEGIEALKGSIAAMQAEAMELLQHDDKTHHSRHSAHHGHHHSWEPREPGEPRFAQREPGEPRFAQGGAVMQSLQEQQAANGFGLGENKPQPDPAQQDQQQPQQKKKGGKVNALKFDKGSDLKPIHVSENEVKYFNFLQHGQQVDPETGLRMYPEMSKIFKNKEVKNEFIHAASVLKQEGQIPPEIQAQVEQLHQEENIDQYTQPIPSDDDPDIQKLVATSPFPTDKYIVLMPSDVVTFMDQLKGSVEQDASYHMEAFGLFDEIVRIAGTLGGAYLGGPMGAALGNMAGHVATGNRNLGGVAMSGLKNYGLASAAQGLGNMAGLGAQGGMFGGQGYGFEGMAGSKIPKGWGGNAASESAEENLLRQARSSAGLTGNNSPNPSNWSGMAQYLAPAAMVGAGLYTNHQYLKKQEAYRKHQEEKQERKEKELRKRLGMDDPLENPLNIDTRDLYTRDAEANARVNEISRRRREREHHAKGDLIGRPIVGKGKGQEDLINDDRVKEGGWIWDASTTANLGDGSTKAGQQEIEKLEKLAVKGVKDPKKFEVLDHGKKPGKVPCALSDGERYTPPHVVTLIGKGSNEKGANILRNITKELRVIKTSNKTELPPPAPDILHLLRKAHRHA